MRVCLSGLPPKSKLGLHVHTWGDWSEADAMCADNSNPHWAADPAQQHGLPEGAMHHSGDLGNVVADEFGDAKAWLSLPMAPAPFSLGALLGRGVVLHQAEDDGVSQPQGNSGPHWGYGVIGIGIVVAPVAGVDQYYNPCGVGAPATLPPVTTQPPTPSDPTGSTPLPLPRVSCSA